MLYLFSANGALSIQPGATPQGSRPSYDSSAEGAIQGIGCISSNFLLGPHRNESRFQSWESEMHQFLGRCPRLE